MPENEDNLALSSPEGLQETTTDTPENQQETPEQTSQEPSPEIPPETTDNFIRLDPDNLGRDISRLRQENQRFREVFNAIAGSATKSRYENQIQQLQLQLQQERLNSMRSMVSTMKPEDIEDRFQKDPNFAQQYTQLIHGNTDYTQAMLRQQVVGQIQNILGAAMERGLPPEKAAEFEQELKSGKYDREFEGGPEVTPGESLALMQRDIYNYLDASSSAANSSHASLPSTEPSPVETKTTPEANSQPTEPPQTQTPAPRAVDTASPDLSGQRTQTPPTGKQFTREEIASMTPEQMLEAFPNDGDWEKAIKDGRIEGYDPDQLAL